MTITNIIAAASDSTLAGAIVGSYCELERNYFLQAWKTSELDAGHFVEATRRFIDLQLFGSYTPIGKSLTPFNDAALKRYESASGEESYRIHMPRLLWTMYGIRNKRGVGHLAVVKPNEIDASLILHSAKWILAEILRLNGPATIRTEQLLHDVIERRLASIWEINGTKRVLDHSLNVEEKVLVLLLQKSPQTDVELRGSIEYKNDSRFKSKLQALHDKRLIERHTSGNCFLSPTGTAAGERLLARAL